MNIFKLGKICGDQDGAICGDYIFRFNSSGDYSVYSLASLDFTKDNGELEAVFKGKLDRYEEIVPHSNAVFFGNNYYEEGDEFPILYSNLYNNYASDNEKTAVLLCYRVLRNKNEFATMLLGEIKICFKDEKGLWRSSEGEDARPYGNFISNKDSDKLFAFVMIDNENLTRYFAFNMPDIKKGETNKLGIKSITLNKQDIVYSFDTKYHQFIQGACLYEDKIYSTEGFAHDNVRIPAIRVIDSEKKEEVKYLNLTEFGYFEEPEFIDFYKGICLYSDAHGNLYKVEF